jgi:hypothetical protein
MDEAQLQALLQQISQQVNAIQNLQGSIGKQNRAIEKLGNALEGKKDGDKEDKKGIAIFEKAFDKFTGIFTAKIFDLGQQIAGVIPTALFSELPNLQNSLAGLGSDLSLLTPAIAGLDGGFMVAAQGSTKLLEMGFDPLNRQVLNLAGRMSATNQNTAALFGSIENLIKQTDLSNNEIGSLAMSIQESSEQTGVSSERIVNGLNKLSGQLAFFNIGGLSNEVQQLTLSLQTGLPAALQELPAQLIGGLVQGGPALRSILGFEGNLDEMLRAGSGGEAAFQASVIELRDRLDQQIGLSQLSVTELQAIAPAFGGPQILNQIKQLGDAFEAGEQRADEAESFYNSLTNLMNQIKAPLQIIAAGIFNVFSDAVAPIAKMLQPLGPQLQEFGEKIGEYLLKAVHILLDLGIYLFDYIIPILAGAWAATKTYQMADFVAQKGIIATLGAVGSIISGGTSIAAAAAAVGAAQLTAVTAAVVAGATVAAVTDNLLDPVADGLRSIKDGIDQGNKQQQQQQTQQRLATANINNLTGQSDYERFIQSFMSNNIASLMLTESGNAEVFRTLVDRLGLIAAASLRTATNTTPTTHPPAAAGGGTPPRFTGPGATPATPP